MNGYRIHVYEKNYEGWCGHADHADGRKVYAEDEPVSLGDFLESAKTAVVADALRELA